MASVTLCQDNMITHLNHKEKDPFVEYVEMGYEHFRICVIFSVNSRF